MSKNSAKTLKPTPSWSFLPTSARLAGQQVYNTLWLILIPSILAITGQKIINDLLANNYSEAINISFNDGIRLVLSHGQIGLAMVCIASIWSLLVYPATIVFATRTVRGSNEQPLRYLLDSRHYFWRLYGTAILINFIIFFGLLALIVPGLIFARRYILSPYYLVERDLGVVESMKLSSKLSKSHKGEIWGSIGVVIAMGLASSIVTGLGWAGLLLGPLAGVLYFFGLSLRQKEISQSHKS